MSQKEHSRAHRRRTYKRVRGVILILLVLGIIWGITALVRHNAAQPDPGSQCRSADRYDR